ncbi:hypothetical protein [Nocardia sp. NBC_00511]|uniref:hypothetical protein n=1 Tax=Nocardia sp. NBC_00511 TaxID=2903591 RepID=UPI0030E4EC21
MRYGLVLAGLVAVFLGVGIPMSAAHPAAHAESTDIGGTLTVDGHDYGIPTDCVTIRRIPHRLAVDNATAERAKVYLFPGCRGGVTHIIEPGRSGTALGASVLTN